MCDEFKSWFKVLEDPSNEDRSVEVADQEYRFFCCVVLKFFFHKIKTFRY